ncbi:MAG: GHKL domain-containing protein, partial [Enterocloster bolteae]
GNAALIKAVQECRERESAVPVCGYGKAGQGLTQYGHKHPLYNLLSNGIEARMAVETERELELR